ncbi:50S ribosomal protein L11 methyltransferase [Pollutibacter soli]|uniref:50S ribosomal protein L11 methyltransferase n=1 Tax=Pollutibacter soli TaxID=3034157 RepID=UPI0030138F55
MNRQFFEISFRGLTPDQIDLLSGILPQAGFDGFEEKDTDLFSAFADTANLDKEKLDEILRLTGLVGETHFINEKNWNEEWEQSFEPVIIPTKVGVRAFFHAPVKDVKHEIVITPKMSFGTGHHATTYLMMEQMLDLDFREKNVLDFGTGTGILAILAEQLGARSVFAIDNDEWSVTNALENIGMNKCSKIQISLNNSWERDKKFDIILANINKGVILENREHLVRSMVKEGLLILSGLLVSDQQEIEAAFESPLGKPLFTSEKNNWISLTFRN